MSREGNRRYLGMKAGDLDRKPYARYWNPTLAPLPAHAHEALAHGPVAGPLLPSLAEAPQALQTPCDSLENGYSLLPGGALHIAIRTEMSAVTPAMVDWWFGWHSDEPQRYKLWHPRAHVHAEWRSPGKPNATGREAYIGRTSCVDEYVGSTLGRYFIRFVTPESLGLDSRAFEDPTVATAICARIGFAGLPLDFGYLVHYVSKTDQGAEMRSRFWIGGEYARARRGGLLANLPVHIIRKIMRPAAGDGSALLVHCSQEMSHLATFLPALYSDLVVSREQR